MKTYKFQQQFLKIFALAFVLNLNPLYQAIAADVEGHWQSRFLMVSNNTLSRTTPLLFNLENILEGKLKLSALQLDSRSVFNKMDPAVQIFRLSVTIGALILKQLMVFSHNIVEVDENFQIKNIKPDVGQIKGQYLLFFDKDPLSPTAQLISLFEPTLTEPLILRKATIEAEIRLGQSSLSILGLLANWGAAMMPRQEFGMVLVLSVETIASLRMHSEIYIGARRGFECFFTCSSNLRFLQGRVVPGFQLEYARLWLRNIKVLGVIVEIDTAYNWNLKENPCSISYFQIRHWLHLPSLRLDITDVLHFKCNLLADFHTIITSWTIFSLSITALWTDFSGGIKLELQELILVFSLNNLTLSSDIFFCSSIPWCFGGYPPVYKTDITLSWARVPWKAEVLLVFIGFLRPFDKLFLSLTYTGKEWDWQIRTTLRINGWKALELSLGWRF